MIRWKMWDTDKCPCCLTETESDSTHIFHCKLPEMSGYRNELYSDISQWMKSVSTHPVIEDMIICALSGDPIALPQENYATWRPLQKALCYLP